MGIKPASAEHQNVGYNFGDVAQYPRHKCDMMPSSFTVVGLLLVVVATCGCCTNAAKIEHVVVVIQTLFHVYSNLIADPPLSIAQLMEENRSFDHMVGWLKRLNPDINGLEYVCFRLMCTIHCLTYTRVP